MLKIGGQRVPTSLLLLVATDCVLIAIGLVLATVARFSVRDYGPAFSYLATWQTFFRFLLVILICEVALYFNDLYDFRLISTRSENLLRLLHASGLPWFGVRVPSL